jgi:hypothetical protein
VDHPLLRSQVEESHGADQGDGRDDRQRPSVRDADRPWSHALREGSRYRHSCLHGNSPIDVMSRGAHAGVVVVAC